MAQTARRIRRRVPALIVAAAATASIGLGGAMAATPTGPPVVKEKFTLLPCSSPNTTLGIEGCAEHRLVRLDKQINTLSRRIYYTLKGSQARRAFVTAANGWLKSRRAGCLRKTAVNMGGTLAPIVYVECEITRDRARIGYLDHRLSKLRAARS